MHFIFLIIRLIRPIPLVYKAHKHVLQEVFALQYQSKDWVYFVYVFRRCVQIFKRPLNLYALYFPHHWADMNHIDGTQGAQIRIGGGPRNFVCEFIMHKQSIASLEFMYVASKYPDILICAFQVTLCTPISAEFGENTIRSTGGGPRNFVCEFIMHQQSIASLEFMYVASKYPDILICAHGRARTFYYETNDAIN